MRNTDARSKKIVFLSSCLLNANNKVMGLSRYAGICKEVLDVLYKHDFGVMQMPCPETLYAGVNRWWQTKNLYDNPAFRRHCRKLAEQMVDYMENYEHVGYETVLILSCNGSPTCGVTLTSHGKDWGGETAKLKYNDTLVAGSGVYIEELTREIKARKLGMPLLYGLDLDDESKTTQEILAEFEKYIEPHKVS
ncbi:MAG: CD3072 family TudS-related putative desulfidase [bacterium]